MAVQVHSHHVLDTSAISWPPTLAAILAPMRSHAIEGAAIASAIHPSWYTKSNRAVNMGGLIALSCLFRAQERGALENINIIPWKSNQLPFPFKALQGVCRTPVVRVFSCFLSFFASECFFSRLRLFSSDHQTTSGRVVWSHHRRGGTAPRQTRFPCPARHPGMTVRAVDFSGGGVLLAKYILFLLKEIKRTCVSLSIEIPKAYTGTYSYT